MNNKVIINPQSILRCNFKHLFTYKLLHHILTYYDIDKNRVLLDKNNIILKYNSNYHSVNNAIDELIYNKIISKYIHRKNCYIINENIFSNN